MNSGLVHAVIVYKECPKQSAADNRLLISFFMGYIDQRTVIQLGLMGKNFAGI